MVAARKSLVDSGGAVTKRRLNRREYGNTLRDLLGVEIDVQELPADMQLGRFDTVSSGLFIWADQIEQYHSHGMTAIDEAWKRYGGNSEVKSFMSRPKRVQSRPMARGPLITRRLSSGVTSVRSITSTTARRSWPGVVPVSGSASTS